MDKGNEFVRSIFHYDALTMRILAFSPWIFSAVLSRPLTRIALLVSTCALQLYDFKLCI